MSTAPLLASAPTKKIALPVRVEPKVFFANERTFLSWMNFAVILGTLSVGLLNFSHDNVGQGSAIAFTVVAIMTMSYALYSYHWRANKIRMRGSGGFDDRVGPTMLAVALVAAVIVNLVLRLVKEGEKKGK
ncbi:hypothetical protein G7Y79_00024g055430 [Physcia stellaris]|nr:hypothetical protein G7Y79_00024g055430 [Physcia stellaris]